MGTSDSPSPAVVIVGAGLAGLTTAIALGTYSIPTVLIERRQKNLEHPRADGFTPRTVEIFRSLGLGPDLIPEAEPAFKIQRTRAESLMGQWFEELAWSSQEKQQNKRISLREPEYSPYRGASTPQDQLEPILLDHASNLGVDVRMGNEFAGLSQDVDGVTVIVKANTAGSMYSVGAQYLVAADGHRSAIRETLAIPRKGHGAVNSVQSVLFRAPETKPYLQKGPTQFTIDQPDLKAFMIAYQDDRLVLHLPNNREYNNSIIREVTLRAIGSHDVNLDIIGTSKWDMSAWIADEFARGRVFFVGDAAHSLPPSRGGYGANTGIADGHNLAWKLAQVTRDISDPQLLATYEAERLPVAWLRHDQIFARSDYKTLQEKSTANDGGSLTEALPDSAVEFGQIYRSTGILGREGSQPDAQVPDRWKGQPGTRAPHVWIWHNGKALSTLELFKGDWVVLSEDSAWEEIVTRTQEKLGMNAQFVHVRQPEQAAVGFGETYGIPPNGCVLIRPDGYIAWRLIEPAEDSMAALEESWKTVSHWASQPLLLSS